MVGVEDEDEKERIEEYFKQIQDAYAVAGGGRGRGGVAGGRGRGWKSTAGVTAASPNVSWGRDLKGTA